MNSRTYLATMIASALFFSAPIIADDLTDLKSEISKMRQDYEQRITELEQRLELTESTTQQIQTDVASVQVAPAAKPSQQANGFNPAISAVLNGQFSDYKNDPNDYEITGFSLGEEAGLAREGFSLGESEITLSANVDQLFYGETTIALHDHEGETEVEVEEAFIETLGLNNGMNIRAGRFFSPIGYLNEKHIHAWNFADAPLIYRGLFGNQLATDGVKLAYLLPTEQYWEVGGTVGNGDQHPGSGDHSGIGDWLVFAKTGGDIGTNHNWQLGLSHWQASPDDREYSGGHDHGGGDSESVAFNGDTDITNLSFVYKWAPQGNFKQQNFTLLSEYFYLNDDGKLSHEDELASYDGEQYGGFVEGIYQFTPRWKTGLRYDWLGSDHKASDDELLEDADLDSSGFHPQRYSLMLEWLPSEFSRIRAQVNHDRSSRDDDTQLLLQYTVSIGAHGAHSF
jgi:putative OmpL-like beta-barrel porin-2